MGAGGDWKKTCLICTLAQGGPGGLWDSRRRDRVAWLRMALPSLASTTPSLPLPQQGCSEYPQAQEQEVPVGSPVGQTRWAGLGWEVEPWG